MATHHTPNKTRLSVSVPSGSLHIDAQDTQETRIEVEPRNDAARELMGDVRESMRDAPGGGQDVVLEIPERGKLWGLFGRDPQFDVTIVVPTGTDVRVETVAADMKTTGTLGAGRIQSVSGDLKTESVTSDLELKTVSGDLEGNSIGGGARLQTVSGDATLREVAGPLTMKSVSGDLRVGSAGSGIRATSVSGDVMVDVAGSGEVAIKTTSGDIELGIPRGVSVWMDVSSLSGDTHSELDSADGTQGDVTLEIKASSLSGDITLRRASSAASVTS